MVERRDLAVSFDLDGTLLDGGADGDSVIDTCAAIADRVPHLDAAHLLEANGRVWAEYFPLIEDDWALGEVSGEEVSREAWRRTLRACGSTDESLVRFAQRTFTTREDGRQRLFDDVEPLVSHLRDAGIPTALVTNGASDTQRRKLGNLAIEDWFEVVVVSGEIGRIKPDPRVFETVVHAFGLEPRRIWHIGDWPLSDVAGANAAGLTSVWLNRRRRPLHDEEPAADIEIGSLAELPPLLDM